MVTSFNIEYKNYFPSFHEIMEKVRINSGLDFEVDYKTNGLIDQTGRGFSIYKEDEDSCLVILTGHLYLTYAIGVTIRSMIELGGRLVENVELPEWSFQKFEDIKDSYKEIPLFKGDVDPSLTADDAIRDLFNSAGKDPRNHNHGLNPN